METQQGTESRTEIAVDVAEVIRQANADLAVRAGDEAIATVRSALERALREVNSYANRYAEEPSLGKKADVLNWLLNEATTGILNNLRLDLVASAQAKLAVSAAERKIVAQQAQ